MKGNNGGASQANREQQKKKPPSRQLKMTLSPSSKTLYTPSYLFSFFFILRSDPIETEEAVLRLPSFPVPPPKPTSQ
ncbi:hypothetical protein CK203_009883 [Vitis vinifera]|uniref:Uncharacterized protein n=1 Tax=Vitis vinifera TaxID=29760 RepID=A0A438JV50_VITVI|nr:hypothetical protein CK203_009883 [Vitis vinifera]